VRELEGGAWQVVSESDVEIDENQRPYLLSLRLLQELMTVGPTLAAAAITGGSAIPLGFGGLFASPSRGPRVVAAGRIRGDGTALGQPFGGLAVAAVSSGHVVFTFPGFVAPTAGGGHQYVVKAFAESTAIEPSPSVRFGGFDDGSGGGPPGFVLRVLHGATNISVARLNQIPLMVEVTEYPTSL